MISTLDIKVVSLGYCIVALFLTLARLTIRGRARWWWDDAFAVLALVSIGFQTVAYWLVYTNATARLQDQRTTVALFYTAIVSIYCEDWFSRLSLLYLITRITSHSWRRRLLHCLGVVFILALAVQVTLYLSYCQHNSAWKSSHPPLCVVSTYAPPVPIYQIVSGVVADVILVVTPLILIRDLKSAPVLRRRLTLVFSASLVLTAACIMQTVMALAYPRVSKGIALMTEGFAAIITCNLAIVAVGLFKLFGYGNGFDPLKPQMPFDSETLEFRAPMSHATRSEANSNMRQLSLNVFTLEETELEYPST